MARAIQVVAPAKVNLFLGVGARRDDGYHEVITVMHSIDLSDRVLVSAADALSVSVTPAIGIAERDNLAWRAAVAYEEVVGSLAGASIRIEKRIPHAAGLGGGSSDAAAVLLALAALHGIRCGDERLVRAARLVGADVPFFIDGPAALMDGRGDHLVRLLPPLPLPIALIKPPGQVSTAAAYAEFDRRPEPPGDVGCVVEALVRGDVEGLASSISNNLQGAAAALVPAVADALAWASSQEGVRAVAVSGSGSGVFAVCTTDQDARKVVEAAEHLGWWGCATRTARETAVVAEIEEGE